MKIKMQCKWKTKEMNKISQTQLSYHVAWNHLLVCLMVCLQKMKIILHTTIKPSSKQSLTRLSNGYMQK